MSMSMSMSIPYDVIRIIRSFLPWSHRCRMISRRWLREVLQTRIKLNKWSAKTRMYSYIVTFGQNFSNRSWSNMAKNLRIKRQARNSHFRLTWRAAVSKYMCSRCQGCGRKSRANVFGICICRRCQRNHRLKYSYMVTTEHAKRMGISKTILDTIPYHRRDHCHLRFQHLLDGHYEN
jgi:hypothetical protein